MTDIETIEVCVNGDRRGIRAGTTVAELVATLTTAAKGVAVAVDEAVVPRGVWAETVLGAGSRVEVLTAVQGG
ncbi:sulfur carrier protein ThiS [Embleya sp. AB8]|uniref:sulfur carrier protein ThiS n=1 Tax=Embleya sp. AB8 TaxID=3156304 RepID=UPI003C719BEE